MKTAILRAVARIYLPIYDLIMGLGPKWGPVALGYGPVVVAIVAFVFKDRLFDSWMHPDTATVAIFVVFGLTGPLMHVGTRILADRMARRAHGLWPASTDPRFDRTGDVSPTEYWVGVVREWLREG